MARAAFLAGGAGGRKATERRRDLNDIPVELPGSAAKGGAGGDDGTDEGRWDAAGLVAGRMRQQLQLQQQKKDIEQRGLDLDLE